MLRARPNPAARLRLFCFPYAGGAAVAFRDWPPLLGPSVEMCAVELPGHGTRLREPLVSRLESWVEPLASALEPWLDREFAFFGHSLGALLAFEVALRVGATGRRPSGLCVSASAAPHMVAPGDPTSTLPRPAFIEKLRRLGGTPPAVLAHPELMTIMEPMLRADFAAFENYRCRPGAQLDCPIAAFGGLRDPIVKRDRLEGWREHTRAGFSLEMFPGDHFFVNTARRELVPAVVRATSGT